MNPNQMTVVRFRPPVTAVIGGIDGNADNIPMVSHRDVDTLWKLAVRMRKLADAPEAAEKRVLWKRHNKLENTRPLVLAFPEGAWRDIIGPGDLVCEDPLLREWEWQLRARLWTAEHLKDDSVPEPTFDLPWVIEPGDYGMEIPHTRTHALGSFVWDAPLKHLPDDLQLLKRRAPTVDRAETHRRLDLAWFVFGYTMDARIRGRPWWSTGLTREAATLVGLERLMELMMDDPASLHRLMGFLRDDWLAFLNWMEREHLLMPMNEGDYTGSGGLGYTDELHAHGRDSVGFNDQWGFAESQETTGISPAMFEEFVLPYQKPIMEKFGLNCYGCCEPVERRLKSIMKEIPRIRRVSVAPKADQEKIAKTLNGKVIFSRKADPVNVCCGFNEEAIRQDLRKTLAIAKGQPLEIILKDTHTVEGRPERLTRWVEIAREEIDARSH